MIITLNKMKNVYFQSTFGNSKFDDISIFSIFQIKTILLKIAKTLNVKIILFNSKMFGEYFRYFKISSLNFALNLVLYCIYCGYMA